MNYETTVGVGDAQRKVFLQNGFFAMRGLTCTLHRHNYGEIHVQISGSSVFSCETGELDFTAGKAVYVPAGVFHKCVSEGHGSLHCAFQTDAVCVGERTFDTGMLASLRECVDAFPKRSAELAGYLSVICSAFEKGAEKQIAPVADRAFIIREFFANRYDSELTVSDLARELGLSEKQTERLVVKYTGHGFREETARTRAEAAKRLYDAGMPLSKVAAAVGYQSYSGFWKAWKGALRSL